MKKQKVLKKLESRKKLFEEYLQQLKTPPGNKGVTVKKAAK